MSPISLPALDGSITIPGLVDFHLEHNPDATNVVLANSGDTASRISFLEWGRAVHRVSHIVRPQQMGKSGEVVALLLNCDNLVYCVTIMAVMRAGFTPYPMSHRNSAAAICHMLQKTSCHRLIATSASLEALLSPVKMELSAVHHDLQIDELPTLPEIFPRLGHETANDPFIPYPPLKTASLDDIILYAHSSGSTGFPKSIPQSSRCLLSWYKGPVGEDMGLYPVHLTLATLPLPSFHMMGFCYQVLAPLFAGVSVAMFEPKAPALPVVPGPANVFEGMKITRSNALVIVPSWLELWSESDEVIEFLAKLEFVIYSGGPLSPKLGNQLASKGVNLHSGYGTTEFGNVGPFLTSGRDVMDWEYISFYSYISIRWIPQGDGIDELQVLSTEKHPLLIHNLPDVPGYASQDLFVKHPTKEGLRKIVGRVDDVIILATGEKTVPYPIENKILASPYVNGVVMFGRGHNQVGVLIELKPEHAINPGDETALAELRNKIWVVIEEANEQAPAFGRIFKEMILIVSPDKPMLLTPKRTVMRKATLAAYTEEIDELYTKVEASKGADVEQPQSWARPDLDEWLTQQALSINEVVKGTRPVPNIDLFAQGFDSLSATFLRNHIIGALGSSDDPSAKQAASRISQDFVFAHNTIEALAAAIRGLITPSMNDGEPKKPTAGIEDMIAKYSAAMPRVDPNTYQSAMAPEKAVVLLTGSTGGLGSYLLWMLLEDGRVERVYAFNRKSTKATLAERQRVAFEDRGLQTELLSSEKLKLVEGEVSSDRLGLDNTLYEQLRTTCTHVIHNAWRLDFNLSISSFEPNIRGTRNLIDLALTSHSAQNFRFVFTSSIGISQSWGKEEGIFPEESDLPADIAVGNGYGESKFVCEQLLVEASKHGLRTISLRIGQICGGLPEGSWAIEDWIPILIKSGRELGYLPDAQGVATWLPTDIVARTIMDITFAPEPPPSALNIVHPRPVSWSKVMQAVNTALVNILDEGRVPLPFLIFKAWVGKLEAVAASAREDDIKKIPAIKLLSFFQHLAVADQAVRMSGRTVLEAGGTTRFATQKAEAVSQTLREVRPLDEADAERWVRYWRRKGLFA